MERVIIKAENLSKLYRRDIGNMKLKEPIDNVLWALRDLNFEIMEADIVNICGRNGSGKSTLLKILSRVTSPSQGTIKGFGSINSLLETGSGFNPELTGIENTYLTGAMLGMNKREIDKKTEEIFAFAQINSNVHQQVKRYSTGTLTRLSFSVAIHLRSEILILDEALAVIDAAFQQECLRKIKEVNIAEGKTVLIVSHDITTMKQLCNRSIHLANGQIQELRP